MRYLDLDWDTELQEMEDSDLEHLQNKIDNILSSRRRKHGR